MKFVLLSYLPVLFLSLNLSTSAQAETPEIKPFNLVSLARQGYFQDQGIPSHAHFTGAVASGRIQAEDIIKAAIAKDRLSAEILKDKSYLKKVEANLNNSKRR